MIEVTGTTVHDDDREARESMQARKALRMLRQNANYVLKRTEERSIIRSVRSIREAILDDDQHSELTALKECTEAIRLLQAVQSGLIQLVGDDLECC